MIKLRRILARLGVLWAVAVFGGALVLGTAATRSDAQQAIGAAAIAAPDYAGQISRLVQNGRISDLATLEIPADASTARLRDWTSGYLSQIQRQEQERDKQYADAVSKAQDLLKKDQYDRAMDSIVLAYRIAKNPDAFLEQPWVKEVTARVHRRGEELEKAGQWLDSLQLFSDLNTLYEVQTTYKADALRVARRVRLLAIYTPATLLEIRKAAAERDRQSANAATEPAEKAEEPKLPDPASFTRWQDQTAKITMDMMRRAIENARENWVEITSYQQLIRGGIESLRLFLTTPELAKEFPNLDNVVARKQFETALDQALASLEASEIQGETVQTIVTDLVTAADRSVKLPREVVIMEFTDGAMEQLDQFSAVIWPHEVPEFEKNMNGKFGGVGIQISLEGGQLKVISPLEDTPAYKAGIEAGDVITAIDGKSTVGITSDQAVSSIMGTPGTPVVLRIKRADQPEKDYAIHRDIIKVASVKGFRRHPANPAAWDFMIDPESKVGYIRLTGFQEDTAEELRRITRGLQDQGMKGLVMDLRFNPGGLLNAAVEISDMFLQQGTIVSTKGRSLRAQLQAQEWRADGTTVIPPGMPLVVLVNEYSASASEIFAGAMKDHKRGFVIGHRTFGKGSVQNLLPLANATRLGATLPDAMMKLTMAYYYLPEGESLHRRDKVATWGVDPDVVVDLTPDQLAELLKSRRDSEIIRPVGTNGTAADPATQTAVEDPPIPDTQLETALLMMRLELLKASA